MSQRSRVADSLLPATTLFLHLVLFVAPDTTAIEYCCELDGFKCHNMAKSVGMAIVKLRESSAAPECCKAEIAIGRARAPTPRATFSSDALKLSALIIVFAFAGYDSVISPCRRQSSLYSSAIISRMMNFIETTKYIPAAPSAEE
jgi:hypothetical protein